MNIQGAVAIVTGAAQGIGRAVAFELAKRGAKTVAMADFSNTVQEAAATINREVGSPVATAHIGDVTNDAFRLQVYDEVRRSSGTVNICIPAAGITRDRLAVKVDKQTNTVSVYPSDLFRKVVEVNLVAPAYWAMEMVAGIAELRQQLGMKRWEPTEPLQGAVIFIGSVSSLGNKGQISYAATKAGLEGVASTLMMEAIYHGVRCGIIHPGYTDTPMVRALGSDFIRDQIVPRTQLRRLVLPEEIADAICFMVSNTAVSGSLWADAGYQLAV